MTKKEIEIERKFLLTGVPEINYRELIRIEQRYKKDIPERIRQSEVFPNPRKPLDNFWLVENSKMFFEHTLKKPNPSGEGVIELNTELNEKSYDEMKAAFPNVMWKYRHVKECKENKGLKWEIDDFSCHRTNTTSLCVAEIEIPSITYDLKMPDWLKPFVLMEITGLNQFSNFSLASTLRQ